MKETTKKNIAENTSFIMTVFNESESIGVFIKSLMDQTLLPSEIVIVDGGSSDSTVGILIQNFKELCRDGKYSTGEVLNFTGRSGIRGGIEQKLLFEGTISGKIEVKIIDAEGAMISQGRNIAIKNSSNELICVSDAGCILGKDWFYEITKNSGNTQSAEITGGYTYPYAKKIIQAALAVCVLPKKSEIRPEKFMPSSRNISFKKNVWQQAGGYPENMDFGEDMRFNFNVISSGYSIRFNPDAEVYWNLRDNLGAIFRQFFRYAKGDAIGRIYAYRHLIRILTLLAFAGIIIVSIVFSPWFLILLAVLSVFYCYRPYLRINYVLENKKSCIFIKNKRDLFSARSRIILLTPFLLIFIDIAKLSGYIFGFLTRRAYK
jgi:glycosyltransferase involved in cell wall biosynthesis